MLLIYSTTLTPRLEYIIATLMSALGVEYNLTTDLSIFNNHNDEKINYSKEDVASSFNIAPVDLLFENNITEQHVKCFEWNGVKAFYKTNSADFSFDIFAASFYLLSRYEEYLPHQLDSYGRYGHINSIAYKENFLQLPLVNLWLQEFKQLLQQRFPQINFHPKPFTFLPTYDIDIAWSYKRKGFLRNAVGTLRSVVNGEWSIVKERLEVLQKKQKDPFDIYDWLDQLHNQHNLKAVYFFLVAAKQKGYDKNISPTTNELKELIANHSKEYEVGIHPSWQSVDDVELLKTEVEFLKSISGKNITHSRQHYIRMKLPETYRQLTSAGIEKDYSMGYGSINGFRASYCLPYKWYDLQKECSTELTIFPFCFMEANSVYEQNYSLQQASEELDHYYKLTRQVNGMLITIMHNHLLGDKKLFDGWKEMYRTKIEGICMD